MKKIIVLLFACVAWPVHAQTGAVAGVDLHSFLAGARLLNARMDTVPFSAVMNGNRPVALFFTIKGCLGCDMSIGGTLKPNYQRLHAAYGLKIVIISNDREAYRKEVLDYYKPYAFDMYFDYDNKLYVKIPPSRLKDGRVLKAFPTLVLLDQRQICYPVDPFTLETIEATLQNMKKQAGVSR